MALFGPRYPRHDDCAVHGPLYPEDILAQHFRVRRLTVGYDPDEVDDFLDAVAAAMAGFTAPVTAWDIRQHEFSSEKRWGSIDPDEVDDFLECIARTLEGRAGWPPPAEIA